MFCKLKSKVTQYGIVQNYATDALCVKYISHTYFLIYQRTKKNSIPQHQHHQNRQINSPNPVSTGPNKKPIDSPSLRVDAPSFWNDCAKGRLIRACAVATRHDLVPHSQAHNQHVYMADMAHSAVCQHSLFRTCTQKVMGRMAHPKS